jgi:hypothetical protein
VAAWVNWVEGRQEGLQAGGGGGEERGIKAGGRLLVSTGWVSGGKGGGPRAAWPLHRGSAELLVLQQKTCRLFQHACVPQRITTPPPFPSPHRQATVKAVIKRAHKEVYEQGLEEFVFGHPAQVALLGLQFQWTADMQVGDAAGVREEGPGDGKPGGVGGSGDSLAAAPAGIGSGAAGRCARWASPFPSH